VNPEPSGRPDPRRLEEGLRQLRQLGYLATPASTYVARNVGQRRSIPRAVLASSLWIGVGTGLVFALLMVASAVLADPGLLQWPRSLLVLLVDLGLLLSLLFAVVTGLFSAAVLWAHRSGNTIRGGLIERGLVLLPGLLATVYLVDRIGRTLLEGAPADVWRPGAVLLVVFATLVAAILSGTMRGALAMVRLQLHGVWTPPRIGLRERILPAALGGLLALILLASGPYRHGDHHPWFDEIQIQPTAPARPLLLMGVDGLTGPDALQKLGAARSGVAHPTQGMAPTAYWNEIATGFTAAQHGLSSPSTPAPRGWAVGGERLRADPVLSTLVTRLMPGMGLAREYAADRRELRRPPLWEIAVRAGRRARVINWWGTYPAASAEGLEVISDRQWLRHSAAVEADSLLAFPGYLLLSTAEFEHRRAELAGGLDRLLGELDSLDAPPALRRIFELASTADLYHLARASEAAVSAGPELVAILLSGPDILARATGEQSEWPDEVSARFRASYEKFLLARVAEVVSDSGREFWLLGVGRRPDGSVSGSWGIGAWPQRADETAALALARLGVPAAADMGGVTVGSAPVTFGLLRPGSVQRPRVGPDLEQLRSLGYIGD
jgi:hypothetical protein